MPIDLGTMFMSIDLITQGFDKKLDAIQKSLGKLEKTFEKSKNQSRNIGFAWLRLATLGRVLSTTFGGLSQTLNDVYFAGIKQEIWFDLLASMAPILDPLVDLVFQLLEWFLGLDDNTKMWIGTGFAMITVIGDIITKLGLFMWGASGLVKLAGFLKVGMSLGFLAGLGPYLLAAVLLIELAILLWRTDFEGFRDFVGDIFSQIGDLTENTFGLIKSIVQGDSELAAFYFKRAFITAVQVIAEVIGWLGKVSLSQFENIFRSLEGIGKEYGIRLLEVLGRVGKNAFIGIDAAIDASIDNLSDRLENVKSDLVRPEGSTVNLSPTFDINISGNADENVMRKSIESSSEIMMRELERRRL